MPGAWHYQKCHAPKENVLKLTAVIEQEGDGYVATCAEVDVVSQADTIEQARTNLLEAVEVFLKPRRHRKFGAG